ncbi:MAG: hypothetical protein EBS07_10400 [Sphingobacteriia bacterium]|nr:hypothetical protein [Sphingobacteriia bacterium]
MRWTKNKLRSLLKESNYKLTKGYEIKKRSRLNGNMALSFLSGDENTPSIKAIEARAYAREAAENILKAKALKNKLDASIDAEFIGMDDLGRRKKKKRRTSTRRQRRRIIKQPAQCECPELLGLDEIGKERVEGQTGMRIPKPKRKPGELPPLPPGKAKVQMPSQQPGGGSKTRAVDAIPVGPIMTAPTDVKRADTAIVNKKMAEKSVEKLLEKAEDATEQAENAARKPDQPSGFFQGKNMLIIGGVAVAALAGIYFLTKKK